MHQKTVIAASLALAGWMGTGVAQAQDKVELWGVVDAAIRHTNNEGANKSSKTQMLGGGMSQSRWGLNVEEDLGGGKKAMVVLENRFTADNGNTTPDTSPGVPGPFFQLSYVGLQTPYGRLTMGRQWNVLFDVVTSTYASFPYSPYMDAYKPELGMAAGGRSSNSLKYTIANADRSWAAALQYSFAERNNTDKVESLARTWAGNELGSSAALNQLTTTLVPGGGGATFKQAIDQKVGALKTSTAVTDLSTAVKDTAIGALQSYGAFVRHASNGFAVGAGFLRTELPGGSDLDAWTLGGSYKTGALYFNAGYGMNKVKYKNFNGTTVGQYVNHSAARIVDENVLNAMWQGQTNGGFQAGDANKRQMTKLGFGYQFTKQANFGLHYFHAKQSGSVGMKSNGKANMLVSAVDYAFSKRTDAYFAVDHTRISGGSDMYIDASSKARTRTGITAGLRHRF